MFIKQLILAKAVKIVVKTAGTILRKLEQVFKVWTSKFAFQTSANRSLKSKPITETSGRKKGTKKFRILNSIRRLNQKFSQFENFKALASEVKSEEVFDKNSLIN